MNGYAVVIEHEEDAWGAYVPDLPGCVAVGSTRAEVEQLIREAIPLHLEAMREHGELIPPATAEGIIVVQPSLS
jgi:predicted RNase H-like HicB family nuclease